jgi:hypothetical protein
MLRIRVSLVACVLLLVALPSSAAPADLDNTREDLQGTVELAGEDWLDGLGVDVKSNGDKAGNTWGASCVAVPNAPGGSGCDSGYVFAGDKWQCVELVNRLYLTRGWISTRWTGNGGGCMTVRRSP